MAMMRRIVVVVVAALLGSALGFACGGQSKTAPGVAGPAAENSLGYGRYGGYRYGGSGSYGAGW